MKSMSRQLLGDFLLWSLSFLMAVVYEAILANQAAWIVLFLEDICMATVVHSRRWRRGGALCWYGGGWHKKARQGKEEISCQVQGVESGSRFRGGKCKNRKRAEIDCP